MEAKLIKKDEHYFLEVQPYTLGNLQKHTITANTFDKPKGHILQLSLKNCQAIERGYDLDELSKKYTRISSVEFDAFKAGFQKALELMGDKKFSDEDVLTAMDVAVNYEIKRDAQSYQEKIDFLKSLQQTEWDVIVEMEDIQEIHIDGVLTLQPKLDVENCLILKRI